MPLKGLFKGKSSNDAATPEKAASGVDSTSPPSVAASDHNKPESSPIETTKDTTTAATTDLEKRIEGIEADEQKAEQDDGIEYPKAMKLVLITVALCLSIFCMALDNTIIATAIPRITDEFGAINDVGWYGSSYLLTTCAFQLFYGKLYTFFNIKYVYLIALIIFEVGSAVCGAAPNSTAFIIGRAVAGLGTGGIFSGAILIIANTVPLRQRPTYIGFVGGMYGIASVAGPLLGGVFTDKVTWRWCFYINLPLGAVTVLFILFFYNPTRRAQTLDQGTWKDKLAKFDLYGTAIFLPMVICLLLALQWGGSTYPWKDGRIIALLVLFAVLLIVFIIIQFIKDENATVPPRVFKQRSTWSASIFCAFLGASFFVFVYYVPIWFQAIKGASAVQSGIDNLPVVLSLVIASIVAGGLVTTIGYYTPFMLASGVLSAIGAGLISSWNINTGTGMWIGYQILFGVGVGLGLQQGLIAVQTALPEADVPIGTALVMFSQTLGGALFISVAQNVFTNRLLANIAEKVPDINPATILAAGATNLVGAVQPQYLAAVQDAYNTALVNSYYVGVATAALAIIPAIFVEWRSVKGKKIDAVAAA